MGVQFIKVLESAFTPSISGEKAIIYDGTRVIGGATYYYKTKGGVTTWWDSNGNVVGTPHAITVSSNDTSKGTVSGTTEFVYFKSASAQTITLTTTLNPIGENVFKNYTPSVGTITDTNVLNIPANTDVDINVSAVFGAVVKYPIGGRIFYVDETATGATYTFYDANGNVLPTQTVAGLATATQYSVEGTPSKDKFYVSEQQSVVSGNTGGASGVVRKYDGTNYCMWATEYGQTFDSSKIDVFSTAGTTVGTGRRNTQHIFSDWNTAVFFPAHNGVSGKVTCWDLCKDCNDNSINGCNDWFVPSIAELKYLRESGIWGSSNVDWIATTKYGTNSYSFLWSSSAYSDTISSWGWFVNSSDSLAIFNPRNSQNSSLFLALVRAF